MKKKHFHDIIYAVHHIPCNETLGIALGIFGFLFCLSLNLSGLLFQHHFQRSLISSKFNYDRFQTHKTSVINYRQLFQNFHAAYFTQAWNPLSFALLTYLHCKHFRCLLQCFFCSYCFCCCCCSMPFVESRPFDVNHASQVSNFHFSSARIPKARNEFSKLNF